MVDLLDTTPGVFGLLFLVALLISTSGFVRVVYFVSVGYAFSIAAMVPISLWLYRSSLDLAGLVQAAAVLFYGLRLGLFLLVRERSPAYKRELVDIQQRGQHVRGLLRLVVWVGVALLYPLMFTPTLFVLAATRDNPGTTTSAWQWSGIAILVAGLALESLSDRQKSRFKQQHPDRFCDVGLFRLVRCPNYLGEIVFWIGHWIAGIAVYVLWLHWLASLAGLVCIVLVMLGSTRRLELKQDERYGDDESYRAYTKTVPVLLPLVPVYSLRNWKIYLG
ncbi:MAG: DUF1295 domain-containing protein [Pseudomonadota bacterium]